MGASGWVHLEVEKIVKATDKAFLLRIDGEEFWCPRSQVADADDFDEGDEGVTVSVTDWWAAKEGLGG